MPAPRGRALGPLVIGHRGASGRLPENTLAAFLGAMADGADGVELDVRLSRDRIPVVLHDATLRRTTGFQGRVGDYSASELATMTSLPVRRVRRVRRAGAVEPARHLVIPTLEEVLALGGNRHFVFYVELKGRRTADLELEEAVVDVVCRSGAIDRTILLSFNHAALRRVRRLDGAIRTAATVAPELRLPRPSPARLAEIVRRSEASEAALHVSLATRRRVALLREAGFRISAWTVNSPLVGLYLARLGLDAIMTDHPARLVATLSGRAS